MSKESMMETIEMINAQLKENRKVIDAYAGQKMASDSSIFTLCELSKALLTIKQEYKEKLLKIYGVYYMG